MSVRDLFTLLSAVADVARIAMRPAALPVLAPDAVVTTEAVVDFVSPGAALLAERVLDGAPYLRGATLHVSAVSVSAPLDADDGAPALT